MNVNFNLRAELIKQCRKSGAWHLFSLILIFRTAFPTVNVGC